MMTDPLIQRLWQYGHFDNPLMADAWNVTEADLPNLTLRHPLVKLAIRSYQDFFSLQLNDLVQASRGREAIVDGDIGPFTRALILMQRCQLPDFERAMIRQGHVAEATGGGSWPHSCYEEWDGVHAIKVSINTSRMPSFLESVFDQVWKNTHDAYAEMGLKMIRVGAGESAHIDISWQGLGGGTIGLAIVGRGQTCSTNMWAKFSPSYRPSNIVREWTTLFKHELGHNVGSGHLRGGVMNPSIIPGLPTSWKGDPAESQLKRWFGGEPVDVTPEGPRMWVEKGLKDNRGGEVWFDITPPIPAEESGNITI